MQHEFLVPQRPVQLALQQQALVGGGLHQRIEELHLPAPRRLGAVHGEVRLLEQFLVAGRGGGGHRHADAGAGLQLLPADPAWLAQGFEHPFAHPAGLRRGLLRLQ